MDFRTLPPLIGASGVPNRCGITTVKPAATTSSANPITSGVMPGISWMTFTPGPLPLRYVGRVTPSKPCSPRVQPSMRLMGRVWRARTSPSRPPNP